MFPIRDDNPQLMTPFVVYAIVAANAAMWFVVQGAGIEPRMTASLCELGLIPAELIARVTPGTKVEWAPGLSCVLGEPRGLTIVTSMFMHGGWMHIIGNMWFLSIFGDNVEDSMGHIRFLIFYLLCGLAAAGLQTAFTPDSFLPMIGASGAIGGMMGAYVRLYPRVPVHMLIVFGFWIRTIAVPAFVMLGYWFVIQVLGGVGSLGFTGGGTAFWAHIGGFAAGLLLIPIFAKDELVKAHPYHRALRRSRRS